MIVNTSVDMGVRRAALLLHTLAPGDRAALLAQLDAAERSTLDELLGELDVLGIPRDRGLLEQTIAALPAIDPPPATAPGLAAQLQAASVQDIARLLADEPAELVARLLICMQWRWSAELLAVLEPYKRRQVQALLHEVKQPSACLSEALLRSVHSALLEQEPRPRPAPRRRWDGMLARLRRLAGKQA